ncbi:hypothetical protein BDQ17DRAFT_1432033 [Cyathus striatus]|nr:hypothetical protein BDQ17DRAFT_1432033 [Cyathus striatus]
MKNGPNVAGSSTSLSPPVSMSNTGSLRSILRGPGNRRRKDLLNRKTTTKRHRDEDEDSSDEEVQEKSVWYEELGLLSGIHELPPPAPPPPTAITSSFYNESEYPIHLPDPIAPLDYRVLQNRALAFTFQLEKEAKEPVQDNTVILHPHNHGKRWQWCWWC